MREVLMTPEARRKRRNAWLVLFAETRRRGIDGDELVPVMRRMVDELLHDDSRSFAELVRAALP